MDKGSLTVVGSGIKFMSHLTIEAKSIIESADKVLYLVNEPAMKEWLSTHIRQAESLEEAYTQHALRSDTYKAITQTIIHSLKEHQHICVILEGHPTVFAKPALNAVIEAKKRGIRTSILPGISAEAYLFADLMIDPGSCGCQSYEATDFLIHRRAFDGHSHLILWQISVIGMLQNQDEYDYAENLQILINYLYQCYPQDHEVVLYEGSQYPHIASNIKRIPLNHLPNATLTRITTLYLPPVKKAHYDENMIQQLNININHLLNTD
jgi:tetrapyrrole methylase family protein/MazG family protein